MAILVGITSTHCHNDINKGQLSRGGHKLHNAEVGWQKLEYTPSVPNYLSVLTGTQILRNLWGIFKNIQLGSNPGLNQFSIVLFCTQNGVVNGLIRLQSCFHVQFLNFCIKICYNLCRGTLGLAEIWNLGWPALFLSINMIRFYFLTLNLVNWETSHLIWDKDFFWNTQVIWDKGSSCQLVHGSWNFDKY
jgi:hypothetical protein